MSRKIILCRCEDVTAEDVARAVATGFGGVEEVKRYTGFGTGPCQGKECVVNIVAAIARLTGAPSATLSPFTSRAPLVPTELALLAGSKTGTTPTASEGPRSSKTPSKGG